MGSRVGVDEVGRLRLHDEALDEDEEGQRAQRDDAEKHRILHPGGRVPAGRRPHVHAGGSGRRAVDETRAAEGVRRGLYVDIEFKDKKNYTLALSHQIEMSLQGAIEHYACISMPVIVTVFFIE